MHRSRHASVTLTFAIALVTAALAAPAALAGTDDFHVTTHSYAFGQDPMFMPDGQVVVGKDFASGDGTQLYRSNQDGSAQHCLTCGQPAPNNVPAPRPQGDWILFHSWRGHHLTLGSPGYGGMGSALYVMHPDGSHVTGLTGLDATHGAGEGEDDYHAYWSPDGTQIVWTHLNWNFVDDNGQGKWDVRVADFVNDGVNPPHLANIRVVRPADGHWYETQYWAPKGSALGHGFLYTETWGTAMATQLFFCRLEADGCHTTQLTNTTAWNEQALFTPDGKNVIFMSSRDHPGFFNTFATLAQDAGLTADEDYLLTLPIFEAAYFQPVAPESTDLYELKLANRSVRRLTTDGNDGWIIPEFAWNPRDGSLWWTELRSPPGARVPLPLDLVAQLKQEAQFLQNPPVPSSSTFTGGNINQILPTESRTRMLTFDRAGAGPMRAARSTPLAVSGRAQPGGRSTARRVRRRSRRAHRTGHPHKVARRA